MTRASVTLLGGFHLRLDSEAGLTLPTRKAQALLAYLAARLGRACPRDKLLALLWGDTTEARARNSLRQALFTLRKYLPAVPSSFLIEGQTIALNPAAVDVDVASFEQLAATGTPEALEGAAALYQGDLLAGFSLDVAAFEEWLLAERERLHELAHRVLAKLLAHQSGSGQTEAAIQTALRGLALDPLQEPVHRTLMGLYTQQGRWAAAFRQYHVCAGLLQRELGVAPEPETTQLYDDLRQKRGFLAPPPPRPATQTSRRPRNAPTESVQPTRPNPPLVGRERECATLRAALEAARHGNGRVVAVLGEAGIGKSRFVEEIRFEAIKHGSAVLIGRSYESEQILPFGPWVDALRRGNVVSELEGLDGLSPIWRAELARLFPELAGSGLNAPADVADQLRLFEAVAQLVAHLAARKPLLLVLEDVHWADEMSLRLLAFLGRRIRIWPVLIAVTARAEELPTAAGLCRALQELKQENGLLELPLLPLTPLQTVTLVRVLLAAEGELPSAAQPSGRSTDAGERPVLVATALAASTTHLAGPVWRVSEGNPFMIVETFRALRELEATPEAGTLKLPQRIREVIAGRLERLSAHARELVAVGAVIGREVDHGLLRRASGLGEIETAECLEELVRRRVLHVIGDRFDFSHDRIREVAYEQLLPSGRERLHRRVAEAIEETYAANLEPHTLALGHHYREARVWDKACVYFRRAGDLAFMRSANQEAVTCFEHALEALSHSAASREGLAEAVDLRFSLRNALWPLGRLTETFQCLREAQQLADGLDEQRRGWLSSYMAQCFWMAGEPDQAIEWGEQALATPAAIGDLGLQVATNLHIGVAYHAVGQYRQAIDVLTRNVERLRDKLAYERFGLAGLPSVYSRTWVVWSLAEMGQFDAGFAQAEDAVRIAERSEQPLSRICAYLGLGLLCLRKGEVKQAISVLEEARDICRGGEFMPWLPYAAAFLGSAYVLSGRLTDAVTLLASAVELAAARGLMVNQSLRVAWLGEAQLYAGRAEDAARLAHSALELARRHKERGHEAWIFGLLAEIAARGDPPAHDRAERHYDQAVTLAEELGMRPLVAHCRLGLGRLYRAAGNSSQAARHLSTGAAMYSEMGMPFWLERAQAGPSG